MCVVYTCGNYMCDGNGMLLHCFVESDQSVVVTVIVFVAVSVLHHQYN